MPSTSEIILTNATSDTTGEKFKGDGYYGNSDGIHTISYDTDSFSGTITIEATLSTNPTAEADWFTIHTDTRSSSTVTKYVNVTGNFVYLRAKVTRTAGTVNSIRLNH